MTQEPESSNLSSANAQTSSEGIDRSETSLRLRTRGWLKNIWEPLDEVGKAVFGDLWRTIYLTIQDALAATALSIILNALGSLLEGITGKNFSDLRICASSYPLTNVSLYQCFVITGSSFTVWFVFAGRFVLHFWEDWTDFQEDWSRRRKEKLQQLEEEKKKSGDASND